jgi:hypothetical protein
MISTSIIFSTGEKKVDPDETLESEPGRGSTFTIRLPTIVDAPKEHAKARSWHGPRRQLPGVTHLRHLAAKFAVMHNTAFL